MKKILLVALVTAIVGTASIASAISYSFSFSGSDEGGTGTAWMDITLNNNQLTMTLKNTSPVPADSNIFNPGITGFGFNLNVENVAWTSWELQAYNKDDTLVTIGKNNLTSPSYFWKVGTTTAGVTFDYMPSISGMKGALYNPEAVDRLGADPYFTNAFLTMTFNTDVALTLANEKVNGVEAATFIRMQNVGGDNNDNGEGGDGSLKLFGLEEKIPPSSVPEPGTMVLVGAGLAGIALFRRAKRK